MQSVSLRDEVVQFAGNPAEVFRWKAVFGEVMVEYGGQLVE